jgi:hypothetical protein
MNDNKISYNEESLEDIIFHCQIPTAPLFKKLVDLLDSLNIIAIFKVTEFGIELTKFHPSTEGFALIKLPKENFSEWSLTLPKSKTLARNIAEPISSTEYVSQGTLIDYDVPALMRPLDGGEPFLCFPILITCLRAKIKNVPESTIIDIYYKRHKPMSLCFSMAYRGNSITHDLPLERKRFSMEILRNIKFDFNVHVQIEGKLFADSVQSVAASQSACITMRVSMKGVEMSVSSYMSESRVTCENTRYEQDCANHKKNIEELKSLMSSTTTNSPQTEEKITELKNKIEKFEHDKNIFYEQKYNSSLLSAYAKAHRLSNPQKNPLELSIDDEILVLKYCIEDKNRLLGYAIFTLSPWAGQPSQHSIESTSPTNARLNTDSMDLCINVHNTDHVKVSNTTSNEDDSNSEESGDDDDKESDDGDDDDTKPITAGLKAFPTQAIYKSYLAPSIATNKKGNKRVMHDQSVLAKRQEEPEIGDGWDENAPKRPKFSDDVRKKMEITNAKKKEINATVEKEKKERKRAQKRLLRETAAANKSNNNKTKKTKSKKQKTNLNEQEHEEEQEDEIEFVEVDASDTVLTSSCWGGDDYDDDDRDECGDYRDDSD